ncbi:acyltransferase family protein, partial [Nocardiopsis gilva]|uniref:acyltransferase family protein n=1 Tax=Nocardiopsis gilva TaxID=280236 RepID=UPI001377660C
MQGLRAVAVLLVAAYHIWFGRVSGGVDVFLLLTGFLITGSLVRMVERQGRVDVAAFWSRLVKRLFPAASVVLVGVLAAAYLFLPDDRWRDTIHQVVAAALYYENWWLATESVDYLAQNSAASPVQHFWSLSIQGQFY